LAVAGNDQVVRINDTTDAVEGLTVTYVRMHSAVAIKKLWSTVRFLVVKKTSDVTSVTPVERPKTPQPARQLIKIGEVHVMKLQCLVANHED